MPRRPIAYPLLLWYLVAEKRRSATRVNLASRFEFVRGLA
jgi:hypothetical protein